MNIAAFTSLVKFYKKEPIIKGLVNLPHGIKYITITQLQTKPKLIFVHTLFYSVYMYDF